MLTRQELYIENWNLLMHYRTYLDETLLSYGLRSLISTEIQRVQAINTKIHRMGPEDKKKRAELTYLRIESKMNYENRFKPYH